MLYLRARYYDPQTQQFLTRDAFASVTEQPYAYAAGSPTYFTDPSGNCPMCIVVVPPVAGAAVAVAEGILFVGTAITTGLLGALGLNALANAPPYVYSQPAIDPYPVDSSGNTMIGASTTTGGNTVGIKNPFADIGLGTTDNSGGLCPATVYKANDSQQDAVIQIAKEAQQKGSISPTDAQTLIDWAGEYGVPARGPESHPNRPFGQNPHIHVGPVNHLLVK